MLERTFLKQLANGKLYVEDVFSTYLYTGNGSTGQTISNGIDLAGKGGLVWIKRRSSSGTNHGLWDTQRTLYGSPARLYSNTTAGDTYDAELTGFNSSGFGLTGSGSSNSPNTSGQTYASWTFREAPKFFDVVTYTGNGANGRAISHNLGTTPGFILVKRTSNTGNWYTWHRAYNGGNNRGALNSAGNFDPAAPIWGDGTSYIAPTSTTFTVSDYFEVNGNGDTFVAYLFAHDATSDGIIQCGSYTGNGTATGPTVSLGWEPQWLLIKNASASADWQQMDTMRGIPVGGITYPLSPNSAQAEGASGYGMNITATGFNAATGGVNANASGNTYIYIAIRRGPMKTPTSGTSVFSPVADVASGGGIVSTGFPIDLSIASQRTGATFKYWEDRLRGVTTYADGNTSGTPVLNSNATYAEDTTAYPGVYGFDNNVGTYRGGTAIATASNIFYNFRRAPGFFDEVCYTGTGVSGQTFNHNLGVAPELMILKSRSGSYQWYVYSAPTGASAYLVLNAASASATSSLVWNATAPTSTTFTLGGGSLYNGSGSTYVAYLFASCPGVSKVGSFTGNGSSQTINCGFAAGARFVMIKRTNSTGDWYVWDTARGMVAGNDPHLSLNTTAAEVTTDDSVDTDNTGFIVNQVSATNVNVNGATYIYLAIA